MIRSPFYRSLVDKAQKPRFRFLVASAISLPAAFLAIKYTPCLFREETVDSRPVLTGLLNAQDVSARAPVPSPALTPKPTPAPPAVTAPTKPRLPAAVTDALTLTGDDQNDALRTALQSWAAEDPENALVFARSLQTSFRPSAISTVLEALGNHPDLALRAGRQLLSEEPTMADEYGTALIGALARAQQFTTALALVNSTSVDSSRTEWTATIIGTWARLQPSAAPQLATVMSRPGVPDQVFQSFVEGWAASAPSALAEFALTLPSGEARRNVFSTALESWVTQDPNVAAQWIGSRLKQAPEFDQALATLLTRTDRVFCPTETALDWSNSIADGDLRLSTRASIIKAWAEHDRAAALKYIQTAQTVRPEERGPLVAALGPTTPRPDD